MADFYVGDLHYQKLSDTEVAVCGLSLFVSKILKIPHKVSLKGDTFQVVEIAEKAMCRIQCIDKVILPYTIRKIGKEAFASSSLREILRTSDDKNATIEIQERAFRHCHQLQKVIFSKSAKFCGVQIFENCEKLSWMDLESFESEIPTHTFHNCKSLKQLLLTEGSEIQKNAFHNVSLDILFLSNNCTLPKDFFKCIQNATIYVSDSNLFSDLSYLGYNVQKI